MRENAKPVTYEAFLAADSRRTGDAALEIGHDFTDAEGRRYRIAWYRGTGELTFERLRGDSFESLTTSYDDGIASVEVVAQLEFAKLEELLGEWPDVVHCEPRTLARVRARLAG